VSGLTVALGYTSNGQTPIVNDVTVGIPNLQQLLRYICENGFEHHVAANFSTFAAPHPRGRNRYLNWPTHWRK
jgi:L-fucose isomerase-like protein